AFSKGPPESAGTRYSTLLRRNQYRSEYARRSEQSFAAISDRHASLRFRRRSSPGFSKHVDGGVHFSEGLVSQESSIPKDQGSQPDDCRRFSGGGALAHGNAGRSFGRPDLLSEESRR